MTITEQTGKQNMLAGKRIAFVGAGNMAEAILKGLLAHKVIKPSQAVASDVMESRLNYIRETYGILVEKDNAALVKNADIIILAVKPQVLNDALAQAAPESGLDKLFISIVAGVSASSIREKLKPGTRVIRTIPNTPLMVMEGAVGIAADPSTDPADLDITTAVFESVGQTMLMDEKLMNVATGLSGSGPAYVFLMIEALADGAVRMGMPRDIALKSAAQTLLGAARLMLESGLHPGQLKDMVTSPGGTTIAGIHALEKGGVRAALMDAVEAATRRSEELGRMSK